MRVSIFSDRTYGVRYSLEKMNETTAKCRRHDDVRNHLIRVQEFTLDILDGTYELRCRLEALNGT